jgi:hypothetical protein
LRPTEAFERYLAWTAVRFEPFLRQLNLIDALVIRHAEDEMLILNLYPDPVDGQAGYAAAAAKLAEHTEGNIARTETHTGRAFDLAKLPVGSH